MCHALLVSFSRSLFIYLLFILTREHTVRRVYIVHGQCALNVSARNIVGAPCSSFHHIPQALCIFLLSVVISSHLTVLGSAARNVRRTSQAIHVRPESQALEISFAKVIVDHSAELAARSGRLIQEVIRKRAFAPRTERSLKALIPCADFLHRSCCPLTLACGPPILSSVYPPLSCYPSTYNAPSAPNNGRGQPVSKA